MANNCGSCKHWDWWHKGEAQVCKRYPPKAVILLTPPDLDGLRQELVSSAFPITEARDTCGEWCSK